MYCYSEGDLIGAILACRRGEKPYWWYRDVLRQAEQRGQIRITGHSEQVPFWWRKFDDSVEVISEKLGEAIKKDVEAQESVREVSQHEKPPCECEHGATHDAVKTVQPAIGASLINGQWSQGGKRPSVADRLRQ